MKEKGTFLFGIEHEGVVQKEFELRAQKVRDSAEVIDELGNSDNQLTNAAHIYAKRLTIGTIPKVTPDMILDLDENDFELIIAANERLKKNRLENK